MNLRFQYFENRFCFSFEEQSCFVILSDIIFVILSASEESRYPAREILRFRSE
jgi:hypothetical protein